MKYLTILILTLSFNFYSYSQELPRTIAIDTFKTEGRNHNLKSKKNRIQTKDLNFDQRLFYKINRSHTPFKDKIFWTTDKSLLPMTLLVPVTSFIYGRASEHAYEENTGYLNFISTVLTNGITFGLKYSIKRNRPFKTLPNVRCQNLSISDKWSFPSGHSANAFNTATMFVLRYPNYPQVYAPMFLWAGLVSYGRPYWGMHYPSDVLVGALIGSGSAVLVYSLRKDLFKFKNKLFGEVNKPDEASINGNTAWLFAGSFAFSTITNLIFTKRGKNINLSLMPDLENANGVKVNFSKIF